MQARLLTKGLTLRAVIRSMHIRMTRSRAHIATLLAAAALSAGTVVAVAAANTGETQRTAVVIDAAAARDGRDLVDSRLRSLDAEIRLPRTATEAETDVRYLDAQGYRIVVAGPTATEAAAKAGVNAASTTGLQDALVAAAD